MLKAKAPYLILAAALIASVIQAIVFCPKLPLTVATHFGGQGQANGWLSREAYFALALGIQFGTALMMVGLSKLLEKLPASMINIPNREYWLAEERRGETLRFNRSVLIWVTAATAVFLLFVFQTVIDANLQQQGLNMVNFGIALVIYLAVVFGLTIRMSFKFARIPGDDPVS